MSTKNKSASKSKSNVVEAPATEKKVKVQTWRDYNANREMTQSHYVNIAIVEISKRTGAGATKAQIVSEIIDVCEKDETAFKLFSHTGRLFDGRAPRIDRLGARIYQHLKYMLVEKKTIEVREGAYHLKDETSKAIASNAALLMSKAPATVEKKKKTRKSK